MSITNLLIVLFLTTIISWWLTGRLIDILVRHSIVDTANERSAHKGSIPRGGGLVIVGLLLISIITMALVSARYSVFFGFAILLTAWSVLSWTDDRINLSPRMRFLLQILITISTLHAFGYINSIQVNSELVLNLSYFGVIVTFIGVIWMANLYNFMDGIDGLAASQTIVAAITIAFWFWQAGDPHFTFIFLILAAASYGFLIWNWQPAKIFMGDVGSITLGAFFAMAIIFANTRYQIPVLSFVMLFSVFVLDATATLIARISRGEKIWLAHRSHYYQRLADIGIKPRIIVVLQTCLMLLCSIIASITVMEHARISVAIGFVLLLFICAITIVNLLERKANSSKVVK